MLLDARDTFLPLVAVRIHIAHLPTEDGIEGLNLFLGPSHTGRHHDRWETRLKDDDGVFDQREKDKGELEDVSREMTLEDALSEKAISSPIMRKT